MKSIIFDGRSITTKPCGVRQVSIDTLLSILHQLSPSDTLSILATSESHKSLILSFIDKSFTVNFIYVPFGLNRFSLFSYLLLTFYFLLFPVDFFVSPYAWLPFYNLRPRHLKSYFICHDLFAPVNKNFFGKSFLGFFKRLYLYSLLKISLSSSRVIVPSLFVSQCIKSIFNYSSSHIFVLPNLLPIHPEFKPNPSEVRPCYNHKGLDILFVGNSRYYKGSLVLREAWLSILKTKFDFLKSNGVKLRIVTNDHAMFNLFSDVSLSDVYYRVSDESLKLLYETSTISIIPSIEEGYGFPFARSLLSSIPYTIASDIPPFREIIQNCPSVNSDYYFFKTGNASDLSSTLMRVIDLSLTSRLPNLVNYSDIKYLYEKDLHRLSSSISLLLS